jgi:sulfite dehydrogenase (cytochrome) subunit B
VESGGLHAKCRGRQCESRVMKKILIFAMAGLGVFAADKGWKLPPENVRLERGPGVELVTAQCALCHSLDYISIQPRLDRAAWTATITKMKEKYGAPVTSESVEKLVEYLVKTYGTEKTEASRK